MSDETDIYAQLAAPFPRSAVSWRAQNIKKDGSAALALAYIDARDVMNRLDEAVGPENWSDSYEVHEHVTICTIAVRTSDGWVSKSDGAGDTDVEAEKGRLSDAFKRAAVKWQIGRYLYDVAAPWVECECDDTGKKDKWDNVVWRWKRWKVDPWSKVRNAPLETPPKAANLTDPVQGDGEETVAMSKEVARGHYEVISQALARCNTLTQLANKWAAHAGVVRQLPPDWLEHITTFKDEMKDKLSGKTFTPLTVTDQLDKLEKDPGYGKA